jgi:hypothetical protein
MKWREFLHVFGLLAKFSFSWILCFCRNQSLLDAKYYHPMWQADDAVRADSGINVSFAAGVDRNGSRLAPPVRAPQVNKNAGPA